MYNAVALSNPQPTVRWPSGSDKATVKYNYEAMPIIILLLLILVSKTNAEPDPKTHLLCKILGQAEIILVLQHPRELM